MLYLEAQMNLQFEISVYGPNEPPIMRFSANRQKVESKGRCREQRAESFLQRRGAPSIMAVGLCYFENEFGAKDSFGQ